ncbi:MAG: hypothetical protein JWM85_3206, partial [Acidimicrobiaceae bacterium]|nr:hypothetical protein [Acidimicrobiaceae bacterium]
AQDYLVKGSVDGRLLARSLRYATERKRAANTAQRLREAELRAEENDRLERGLLPRPLLRSHSLRCITLYDPGGEEALLGGDFFDVIELQDGIVRAMIGDVAGHGPDEAAFGIRLRVAWRTLVLAGVEPAATLSALQQVLVSERADPSLFATICELRIDPAGLWMEVVRAGHLAPFLFGGPDVARLEFPAGPPIGVVDSPVWPLERVALPEEWAVLLYTDGLVENVVRGDPARRRLGEDGLAELLSRCAADHQDIADIVDLTLGPLRQGARSAASDDVAIVALAPERRL